MHTPPSQPARLRRRLLGVATALPLLAAGTAPAGAGCHDSDDAEGCLSRRVHIPSTIAPWQEPTVTTEEVKVDGATKDAGRLTMKARNDSTTPLSDFTVSVAAPRDRPRASRSPAARRSPARRT